MGESAYQGHFNRGSWKMPEPSLKALISGGGILDVTPATVIQGVQLGLTSSPPRARLLPDLRGGAATE